MFEKRLCVGVVAAKDRYTASYSRTWKVFSKVEFMHQSCVAQSLKKYSYKFIEFFLQLQKLNITHLPKAENHMFTTRFNDKSQEVSVEKFTDNTWKSHHVEARHRRWAPPEPARDSPCSGHHNKSELEKKLYETHLPPAIQLPQFPLFLVKAAGSHVFWVQSRGLLSVWSVCLSLTTAWVKGPSSGSDAGKRHSSSDSLWAVRSD